MKEAENLTSGVIAVRIKFENMALNLAKARAYVAAYGCGDTVIHPGFRQYSVALLNDIDAALDGTIHSFTRNGSAR